MPCIMHGQRTLCFFFLLLCRLYSWTGSNSMNRSHFTASVSGLIQWLSLMCTSTFPVLLARVLFSCKSGVLLFCFVSLCSIIFVSLGHRVLLKFGIQDTLSYEVLKKKVQALIKAWQINCRLVHSSELKCLLSGSLCIERKCFWLCIWAPVMCSVFI